MKTKLGVTIVALSMLTTVFLGTAAAVLGGPSGSDDDVGPAPTSCNTAQEWGHGGSSTGSSDGSYHRYVNDNAIGLLDSCFSADDVAAFATCASAAAVADVTLGVSQATGGNVDDVLTGVNTATDGAGNLYQNDCGGLAGTGTDGEFEYGSAAAALNVRTGSAANGGDGVAACIGSLATAHHGSDTTVFVQDLVLGTGVSFSVSADWARPAGLSNDDTDRNTRAGISHCGDGAIEPCTSDAHAGVRNDLLLHGGAATVVADVTHAAATPTDLLHTLDVVSGCNPLDVTVSGTGSVNPPGGTLANFGDGGASGWLLVTIGVNVAGVATAPVSTAGWVWTGS